MHERSHGSIDRAIWLVPCLAMATAKKSGSTRAAKTSGARPAKTTASKRATKPSAKARPVARSGGPTPRTAIDALQQADSVLVSNNPIAALELLARAWRACRSVRVAELVELVDARVPLHEDASLEAAIKQKRAHALRAGVKTITNESAANAAGRLAQVTWPDPRLAWILLDVLAHPHWRSLPAVTCWQACLDAIVESGDPRILEPLAELGERYTGVIPTSVGVKVQARIRAAVKALREAPPWRALDAEASKWCDAIEKHLGKEVAARDAKRKVQRASADRHAELLTAIYNAPDDDGPRSVYADWLLEIGDPRGELINLQLARAAGTTDERSRARELELLDVRSAEKWLGSIAPVVFDTDQVYARGFTSYARLWKNRAALPAVTNDPAWGTLETIAIGDWYDAGPREQAALLELIAGPAARALKSLVNWPAWVLPQLAKRDGLARIERVEAVSLEDSSVAHLEAWLGAATQPRALSIDTPDLAPSLERLIEHPGFARLDRFQLERPFEVAGWIAMLEPTSLPKFRLHTYHDVVVELTRSSQGARTFDRVRLWRDIPPSWATGPRGMIDVDAFGEIEPFARDRDVVIDQRAPFLPGCVGSRHGRRCPPTEALVANIRSVARSVAGKTGWVDVLPDLIWN
jgi:uncharacterized protein (TIGR02996 family)